MREQLFACEPNYLLTYLTRIENATAEEVTLAAGRFGAEEEEECEPWEDVYEEEGDEAVIKINGMLTQAEPSFLAKLFGFAGTSYPAIMAAIDHAKQMGKKHMRLMVNSPGGEAVAACDSVYSAVRAWGDAATAVNCGLMASAAYWISCGAHRIEAMSPMAETGAIGVVTAGIDDSDLLKNLGVKKVRILSKNAPDKDYSFDTTKGRAALQERVNALESVFIARVAEGRRVTPDRVKADFGQGRVMIAVHQEGNECACALHCGMIDAVAPSVPNLDSRKTPGAYAQAGRETMKLSELLTANPEARAEYDQAIASARAEGKTAFDARMTAAKPYLALKAEKDGYTQAEVDAIAKAAIDVISGAEDGSGLRAFVRMVDMQKEQRKLDAAKAETDGQKETPGQFTPPGAELVAKAVAMKIDVKANEALAKDQGIDPVKALEAAIQTEEQLAKDKARLARVGG